MEIMITLNLLWQQLLYINLIGNCISQNGVVKRLNYAPICTISEAKPSIIVTW